MTRVITKEKVYETIIELNAELGRPVHIADLKNRLKVLEKRDSFQITKNNGRIDRIARSITRLFKEGRISRTESLIRVENYPVSPYSAVKKETTTNVYFYAPAEYAGRYAFFEHGSQEIHEKFVTFDMDNGGKRLTKKEMVLPILKESDIALTTMDILKLINQKYDAYDVSDKQKLYTAASSLTRGVMKPLRKEGLKGVRHGYRWIWYFTEEQLEKYKEEYIRKDSLLRAVADEVRSLKCVPLTRILSEAQVTPEEARARLRRVAKFIPVKIEKATTDNDTRVSLEIKEYKRDSFIDWLGIVIPKKDGYGYETMLVYLESDWEEELKRQIKKSLQGISKRAVVGSFYEKLVARLFSMLCTSEELQNSELAKYMIPFVFRDEKVTNVWITMESGRRGEFDVLIRGTFTAFNVMADNKPFLDFVIPIESKYRMVQPEHVTAFDDKIKSVFGDRRIVFPIMFGLGWKQESLHLTKRLGILTTYFSSIDKLIREMTGTKYRHEHEWKRVEEMMENG
ncbi:MAG: hypothetical protein GXO65_03265, partial [Euryarchaeota archaeon]|nr:hypothetical protein [Euryarchaeota archaeon]